MEKRKNATAKRTRSLFLSLETPSLFPSFSNPFDACQAGYTSARAPAVGVSIRPRSSPLPRDQWRESEVTARADGCRQHSLTRGQLSRTDQPPPVSPRNDVWGTGVKNITLMSVTTQIWVVVLIGRTATSANQKRIPDASSVSNFFARSSDRSFRGDSSGGTAYCHPNRNSLYHSFNSFISLLHIAFYYLYNIFNRSKLNALYKTHKKYN